MNYTEMIIAMYKNEIGINKIAKILKIRIVEVYKCLRDNNLLRKDINQERDEKVCSLYNNKTKITKISEILNIDRHTVTNILKRYNIYNEYNKNQGINTKEKLKRNQNIISLYQSGLSMREVANQTKVCTSTVSNILKHYNKKIRPQHQKGHSKGTSKNRKYFFDLNFFKVIDSEAKAYWLGFLYADGAVFDRGVLSIGLQENDKEHLKAFQYAIKAKDLKLTYNNKTKSYKLDISSVNITNDLIKLGCVPNKSLILKFPNFDQVPEHLIHHFMRGYFDGDGCIYVPTQKKNNAVFSILGTHEFLNEYEKILLKGIDKKNPTKRVRNKAWNEKTESICYAGRNQIEKIFHFLYKDSTIYLKRKFDKFTHYCRLESKTAEDSRGLERN